jgi:hypothetical protein
MAAADQSAMAAADQSAMAAADQSAMAAADHLAIAAAAPAPRKAPPVQLAAMNPQAAASPAARPAADPTAAFFTPPEDALPARGWMQVGWAMPARTPAPAPRSPRTPPSGYDLAHGAYADLARGDRRSAAAGFAAALATDPANANAAAWAAQQRLLQRRWSGSAYVFARASGPADFATATLLGGGQSGALIAFTPDPLSNHPVALTLRGAVAQDGFGIDTGTAQGAIGLRYTLLPGVTLAGEWLVASGSGAASGWTLRLAGGAEGSVGRIDWSAYGEAGTVERDPFAAAHVYAGARLPLRSNRLRLSAGAGVWAGVQDSGGTADRIDIGPSARLRATGGRVPVTLAIDYRVRVAGNAAPGSGVALTLSAGF